MTGAYTLTETEAQVSTKLKSMDVDFAAMAVLSNLFRAANAVRNHFERTVLAKNDLTWTAFVVLWITWIWEPVETRVVAAEAGVSKATLSGVLTTLENRTLVTRAKSANDGRLVEVRLTASGRRLMKHLFPLFNAEERSVVRHLHGTDQEQAARILRELVRAVELD